MKAMKSEIKENTQGTNSDRKETGTQINSLDQKEEINIRFPVRAHAGVAGQVPSRGHTRDNYALMFFSLFLSPFLFL